MKNKNTNSLRFLIKSKEFISIKKIKYEANWCKIYKSGIIYFKTINLYSLNEVIEEIEFKVTFKSKNIILKVIGNTSNLFKTEINYSTNGIEIIPLKKKGIENEKYIYESCINEKEFLKIKGSKSIYFQIINETITEIELPINKLNLILQYNINNYKKNKILQEDFQKNLDYNLKNKVKEYISQIKIGNLVEQYEIMIKRLIYEKNFKQAIVT